MSKSQVPQPILIFHLLLKDFLCYSCNSSSFIQICPEFERKHSIAGHLHLCNDLLTWRYICDCTHIIFEEHVVTFVNELPNAQKITFQPRYIVYLWHSHLFSISCSDTHAAFTLDNYLTISPCCYLRFHIFIQI